MARTMAKLRLEVEGFDESLYLQNFAQCESMGVRFETMHSLGDTNDTRRALYELNKTCSSEIPGGGEFLTYEAFCEQRLKDRYDPRGVVLAIQGNEWIGMTAVSDWSERGFAFNEMTGVLPAHRRQGIALTLKVLGILSARKLGAQMLYGLIDVENAGAIAMNRRLGYVDTNWQELHDIQH